MTYNTSPKKLGSEYYRGFLSQQGKYFYDTIFSQLNQRDYSGVTSFSIINAATASTDCFAAYKAIRDDNPQFFFLGYQSEFTRQDNTARLTYPMLYSPDIIERIQKQLSKYIFNLIRGTAELPLIDAEITIYERIAKKLRYINHGDVRDHNLVGPLLRNQGVCEAHNALLMLCYRRIGIPCIKVYGKTNSEGSHCWCIAWIDTETVHCDVTWDNAGCNSNTVCFNYFNLSDRQISSDHYAFSSNIIPECRCENLTYYRYKGMCINSDNELERYLIKNADTTQPLIFHLEYTPTKKLFDIIKQALNRTQVFASVSIKVHSKLGNIILSNITKRR